jgi:phosphoglycerate dehydrogenase-like enzyme
MPRVHMVREPEAELAREMVEALVGRAEVGFGQDIHPDTTILVEGQLTPEHMAQCPGVRHVVIPFAGLQPKTRDVLLGRPAVTAHNLHHNAAMTAEMALALIFACARRIVPLHNGFKHDDWEPRFFCRDAASLCGKTVLVLGYGEVGRRVGAACDAMGMTVLGVRTTANDGAHGVDELHDLLPHADFLVVTLPGTPATIGLIGEREIAFLPNHAIVVNVGRGSVIDEKALYEALRDERLDSAGLDVWWVYPKSPEDKTSPSNFPFGALPNVVMTPHVGGATRDAEPQRIAALIDLLNRLLDGDSSANRVDLERGY